MQKLKFTQPHMSVVSVEFTDCSRLPACASTAARCCYCWELSAPMCCRTHFAGKRMWKTSTWTKPAVREIEDPAFIWRIKSCRLWQIRKTTTQPWIGHLEETSENALKCEEKKDIITDRLKVVARQSHPSPLPLSQMSLKEIKPFLIVDKTKLTSWKTLLRMVSFNDFESILCDILNAFLQIIIRKRCRKNPGHFINQELPISTSNIHVANGTDSSRLGSFKSTHGMLKALLVQKKTLPFLSSKIGKTTAKMN